MKIFKIVTFVVLILQIQKLKVKEFSFSKIFKLDILFKKLNPSLNLLRFFLKFNSI